MAEVREPDGWVHVLRDVTLVGEIVLDPAYDPPWPGAGVWKVVPPEAD